MNRAIHSETVLDRRARKRVLQNGRAAVRTPTDWNGALLGLVILAGAAAGWLA